MITGNSITSTLVGGSSIVLFHIILTSHLLSRKNSRQVMNISLKEKPYIYFLTPPGADITETTDPTVEQEAALKAAQEEAEAAEQEEEEPEESDDD